MRHGSLFSGIGGFDLAAEWMGWENVFHCEWNPFGQKILHHYWPDAEQFNDITKTDFKKYYGTVDIISGGFPCQPYSSAGKRKGKEDERHLWPEMLRAIREIQPRWVVGENVLGLVNWSGGLVFHEVQADLEAEGYEVQPFLLPAAAVGAPHRRDRIWFVAYNNSIIRGKGRKFKSAKQSRYGKGNENSNTEIHGFVAHAVGRHERSGKYRGLRSENAEVNRERTQTIFNAFGSNGNKGNVTDTERSRLEYRNKAGNIRNEETKACTKRSEITNDIKTNDNVTNTNLHGFSEYREGPEIKHPGSGRNALSNLNGNGSEGETTDTQGKRQKHEIQNGKLERKCRSGLSIKRDSWHAFPSESPICGGNDGLPTELDGITFSKWRNESIKGYGNAIVPQVVYQIFKSIQEYELQKM
jgi:DNA (cytosine-5)-methyltransferase 1